MVFATCDLCGDRVLLPQRSKVKLEIPTGAARTVEDVLAEKDPRVRAVVFDACKGCIAGLELSLKTSKLRVLKKEAPV